MISQQHYIPTVYISDKCKSIENVRDWDKDETFTTSIVEFIRADIKRLEGHGKIKTFEDLTYDNVLDFNSYLKELYKIRAIHQPQSSI